LLVDRSPYFVIDMRKWICNISQHCCSCTVNASRPISTAV